MPKRTFECTDCKHSVQRFVNQDKTEIDCEKCHGKAPMCMPNLGGTPEVRETVDKYTNKKWKQDQVEILKERKAMHYWEVEVPRLVNSGLYGLDTMLEQQWVYYDEKGNLITRTKPPEKS